MLFFHDLDKTCTEVTEKKVKNPKDERKLKNTWWLSG